MTPRRNDPADRSPLLVTRDEAARAAYEPPEGAHDYRTWRCYQSRLAARPRRSDRGDAWSTVSYAQAIRRAAQAAGEPHWGKIVGIFHGRLARPPILEYSLAVRDRNEHPEQEPQPCRPRTPTSSTPPSPAAASRTRS